MHEMKYCAIVFALGLGCNGTDPDPTGEAGTGDGSGSGSESSVAESGTSVAGTTGGPAADSTESGGSSGESSDTGGSTGSSGGDESTSGSTGGTTGGMLEPGDAEAVDWPAPCSAIASEDYVCISAGESFDGPSTIVAMSLTTGAVCDVQTFGGVKFFDVPPQIAWIGDSVAWPGQFEGNGMVVDLNTGTAAEVGFSEGRFFDYSDGVLVDLSGSDNFPYFSSIDDLLNNAPTETYALSFLGSRGFTVGDVLHTYNSDGTSDGSVDILTGAEVPAVLLQGFDGFIDGMAAIGDAVAVLNDGIVYIHDLESGKVIDSQPIAYDSLRGLACSPGIAP
ncbi:MAG: hypothetical protein AAF721_35410 [Myxococcota bacterium]